jgi:hypothetical protein
MIRLGRYIHGAGHRFVDRYIKRLKADLLARIARHPIRLVLLSP